MLEIDHGWDHNGDSGGLTPVRVGFGVNHSVLYMSQPSTIATTGTLNFQTSPESTGPWFTEASTSFSTAGSTFIQLRLTGPYLWMRPHFPTKSTGVYRFRLIGVGDR